MDYMNRTGAACLFLLWTARAASGQQAPAPAEQLPAAQAPAQRAGDVGGGVVLGNPTGFTGKVWIDESQAVDAGVGFSTDLAVYGDYLWHSWKVLPQPSEGRLPVYIGLGAQVRTLRDTEFGIRTVAGVAAVSGLGGLSRGPK